MTFLHFAVTSLDILKATHTLKPEEKERIVNWIYHLQITGGITFVNVFSPSISSASAIDPYVIQLCISFITEPAQRCGFQGSSTFMMKKMTSDSNPSKTLPLQLFSSHITMTYAALVTLLTLGDDLERVDRDGILKGVAALQNHDGR